MLDTIQILDVKFLEIIRNAFVIQADWFQFVILILSDSEPLVFSLFLMVLWFYGVSLKNN